jgi:hypothetical protein
MYKGPGVGWTCSLYSLLGSIGPCTGWGVFLGSGQASGVHVLWDCEEQVSQMEVAAKSLHGAHHPGE